MKRWIVNDGSCQIALSILKQTTLVSKSQMSLTMFWQKTISLKIQELKSCTRHHHSLWLFLHLKQSLLRIQALNTSALEMRHWPDSDFTCVTRYLALKNMLLFLIVLVWFAVQYNKLSVDRPYYWLAGYWGPVALIGFFSLSLVRSSLLLIVDQ